MTNYPNPRLPEDAIVETLRSVISKLNDSVMGRCDEDYQDEISAYWAIECSGERVYLFDIPHGKNRTVYGSYTQGTYRALCIASSAERARGFASRLGGTSAESCSAFPCIALELSAPLSYPFPNTILEWDNEISRSGKGIANAYRNFVVRCKMEAAVVVLSAPVDSGRAIFCYTQKSVGKVDGFRKGITLYHYVVHHTPFGNERVEKRQIENASQSRLFRRGGVGAVSDGVQAIIGCGSLGSHLAKALADSGATEFSLIDNDVFETGNVARHVCGFESIGANKADALKRHLEAANPNVTCAAHKGDANVLLESKHGIFEEASAVFSTAADPPLEYHLVESFCDGAIAGPLVIMWLEPFMLAAHALVLNKPQKIFDDGLFDAELHFSRRVIANGDELYVREAGCQTTYMPYAALDVQAFLIDFMRSWRHHPLVHFRKNYHFAWIGRISDAEAVGASVSPEFAGVADYSRFVERID